MRAHLVAETDSVDIVMVARDPQNAALCLEVVNIHTVVARARHNLIAVTAETQ